jgi:hypothetical protein
VNSIRWDATGERATITRNPELKPKLSLERSLETAAATANEPELKKKVGNDDRKARSCASHGWRQNGRKRRRDKQ